MERLGKYTLLRRLTSGGMAELFLARQTGVGGFEKMVVIKRLHPALAADDQLRKMFINEARIAARLSHPNVVQIYDLGAVDDHYFIAMEYVNGHDLAEVQVRAAELEQQLRYDLIVYIGQKVCAGLDHAHTLTDGRGKPLGLVHRDVSPENVLVSYGGDVKLVDFGIAKATAVAAETQAGLLKGKFGYMSPEQCRNEKLDARSDVFGAGIVLYELVCRRRLFRRQNDFATMRAVLEDPIPPPSAVVDDCPDGLEQAILRALDRDPGERFPTAAAMKEALEQVALEEGWRAGPADAAEAMSRLFPLAEQLQGESEESFEAEPDPDLEIAESGGLSAGQLEEGPTVAARPAPAHLGSFGEGLQVSTAVSPPGFDDLPEAGDLSMEPTVSVAPPPAVAEAILAVAAARVVQARPAPRAPSASPSARPDRGALEVGRTMQLPELQSGRRYTVIYVVIGALVVLAVGAALLSLKLRESAQTAYPVAVTSEPPGASVYIDGEKRFGITPLALHGLSRGKDHTLLLVLEGFRPWQQTLKLDGSPGSREARAVLERVGPGGQPGSLALEVNVESPEIFLDGEAQDVRVPLVIEHVRSGMTHTLVVRKEGYQGETLSIAPLAAGERRRLTVTLQPGGREKAPPPKKGGKKAEGKAAVAPPRPAPSLQSPLETKIGEHLPK